MHLGPPELLIIFLIVLLIFGGAKIPQLFKSLGRGIKEFKNEIRSTDDREQEKTEGPEKQS